LRGDYVLKLKENVETTRGWDIAKAEPPQVNLLVIGHFRLGLKIMFPNKNSREFQSDFLFTPPLF